MGCFVGVPFLPSEVRPCYGAHNLFSALLLPCDFFSPDCSCSFDGVEPFQKDGRGVSNDRSGMSNPEELRDRVFSLEEENASLRRAAELELPQQIDSLKHQVICHVTGYAFDHDV